MIQHQTGKMVATTKQVENIVAVSRLAATEMVENKLYTVIIMIDLNIELIVG